LDEKDEVLYSQPLSKVPIRKTIMSVYGITSFEHHAHKLALTFCKYSKYKKKVIQFIPSLVWKQIYANYRITNLEYICLEDTLKDQLWDALKKLKTVTSNDDWSEKVML
jgi:hypothetical protein